MSQTPAVNKVQLTAYAKVDAIRGLPERHPGLPVLVRVVAPPGMAERTPIDLVAVLDVSFGGLAPANRMDLLKRAMEHVIEKLSSQDRLAIVPVQITSALPETYDLIEMNAKGRMEATTKVQSLEVSGDNKLSTALKKAAEILEGRTEEGKKKAGFIILISDGDDSSISRETMTSTYSVHAFGFRDAHNVRSMHYIANSYTGTYGILNDEHDRITDTFTSTINKITSIVAVQTEVDIVCSDSSTATLSAIESGRFKWEIEDNRKTGHVLAFTLQAGGVRKFIVYVDNVGEDEYNELPRLLTVRVKYQPYAAAAASRVEERLDGQVVVVRKGTAESKEVAAEIVRVEAVRIVGDILDKYKDNVKELVDAVDELRQHWHLLKDSEYGREAGEACLISALDAEMREMEAGMRRCSGLSYMLSWQTCHTLQHQTRAPSTSSATKGKGSQQADPRQQQSLPYGMVGGTVLDTFMASGAHAKAGVDCGGGSRKRKYQHYTELEMIEQRLAYWSKVKCELPPMQHDGAGDCPDQITMIFREASRESIDRAMFHDVFLAVVHATGRRS